MTDSDASAPGVFRRALRRLTEDDTAADGRDLRQESAAVGATPVNRCAEGTAVQVAGVLRSVVLRPRAGAPTLEAELYDGTGSVTLIWLGRRRIGGVNPGRSLVVRGRLARHEGRPAIYNPAYELRPAGG